MKNTKRKPAVTAVTCQLILHTVVNGLRSERVFIMHSKPELPAPQLLKPGRWMRAA
jgi:hypothetical protein